MNSTSRASRDLFLDRRSQFSHSIAVSSSRQVGIRRRPLFLLRASVGRASSNHIFRILFIEFLRIPHTQRL